MDSNQSTDDSNLKNKTEKMTGSYLGRRHREPSTLGWDRGGEDSKGLRGSGPTADGSVGRVLTSPKRTGSNNGRDCHMLSISPKSGL